MSDQYSMFNLDLMRYPLSTCQVLVVYDDPSSNIIWEAVFEFI